MGRIRNWFENRRVDSALDTTQKDHSLLRGFTQTDSFGEQLDTLPEMNERETAQMLLRGLGLVRYAKGLFAAKWVMSAAMVIPGLFLGWFGKIITDHIILGVPLVADEVNFPPHMLPILRAVEGREPMEIMLFLVVITVIGLFLIGTRAGGTGAGLYQGRDNASRAENAISTGGSGAGGIWGIIEYYIDVRLTQRIVNGVRKHLFSRLIRSNMTTLDDQRVGDRLYRVLYDTPMLYTCITELTFSPFFVLVNVGLTLYQIWYTYGHMQEALYMVLCVLMFPVVLLATLPFAKHIRRVSQNQRAAGSAATNAMEETMDNITAVQSLGGMEQEKQRFSKRSAHTYWRERLNVAVWVGMGLLIEIVAWPIGFFLAWVVAVKVIEGEMTVGDFFALFGLFMGLRGNFQGMGRLWINLQDQAAAARRIFFFIDYPVDGDGEGGASELPEIRDGITLDDVSFTYPGGQTVLKDIDLEIQMNNVVAFVGPTGAGKTSLAYLIPGFLRPSEGTIRVDGLDLSDVSTDSLRDQVAYVFQEHMLFSESIRSNLLIANPNATQEQMLEALQTASCMDFINELPDGIDTVLGRSGDTLSVGQQQRLCIARGLVRDAKVLILDEPTAALDPQTENLLVHSLRDLARDRIVIVIAHRLSTIRRADRIVFLENGEIRDHGSHDELMAREDSPYRRFVELQGG